MSTEAAYVQRWSRGHEARGQGQGHKKIQGQESPSEDRPSRGQGQECSRPRVKDTGASVLKKKGTQAITKKKKQKKKVFKTSFQAISK